MTDKDKKEREQKKKRGHRHLTPLEIITIAEAFKRGEKVSSLATQFGVSRQTIYNAIKAVKEARVSKEGSTTKITSNKRKRTTKIPEEIRTELVKLKKKYPSWGVEYLRKRWIEMGKRPLAKSMMYKILKNAGLMKPIEKGTTGYSRFEMIKPWQLYQMDIRGKLYLKGIGWVHGFAIIDDYSRFVPAMRYYLEMRMSNAILTLDRAIREYGIPEAIYLDNGSQFKSRGERLNNFELFCKAYNIRIITSTPYRPQGKGKIERFFGTVENQFIAEVKAKIEEEPGYTLLQLNKDLESYINEQYHPRIHGGTRERPVDRFGKGSLRTAEPPVVVQQFLERTESRKVNKFQEVSYQGYKIQEDLDIGSKVTVVDMLETIRIEYKNNVIRKIHKRDLKKTVRIKKQYGAFNPISPLL
ncbi:MAG: hypothetical protein BAJALOKI1v1_350003 [Promethearchaeota archaeon]|nr:MAG: hypothetical protein BAJALOKI1v1_350003 [Candidatus Lokiarchaeota archaeon]